MEASLEDARPKRARKSPMDFDYDPEDFTMKEAEGIKIIKGRGEKLGSFPSLKAYVESSKRTGEEIATAHQFLFGKKGKQSKKEMKAHILEFSGYLKPIPAGKKRTDKEVDKEEEAMEVSCYTFLGFACKVHRIKLISYCVSYYFEFELFRQSTAKRHLQ